MDWFGHWDRLLLLQIQCSNNQQHKYHKHSHKQLDLQGTTVDSSIALKDILDSMNHNIALVFEKYRSQSMYHPNNTSYSYTPT
jgi:hypothetical protein